MSTYILGTRTANSTLYQINGTTWEPFPVQPPGSSLAAGVWGGPHNTIWCHNGQKDPPTGSNPAKYLFYSNGLWSEYVAPRTDTIADFLYPAAITGSIDGTHVYSGLSNGNFEGAIHTWNGTSWTESIVGQRCGNIWCDPTGQYVWATNAGGLDWVGSPTVYYSSDYGITFSNIWSSIITDLGSEWTSVYNPRTSGLWGISATEVYLGFGWDANGPSGYNRGTTIIKWNGTVWSLVKITAGFGLGLGSAVWSDGTSYLVAGSYDPMEVWQASGASNLVQRLPSDSGEKYLYATGRGIEEDSNTLYLILPGEDGQTARTKVSTDGGATWPTSITHPWETSADGIDSLSLGGWVTPEPIVQNQSPVPDSTTNDKNLTIYFEIIDENGDFNALSTNVYINNNLVWSNNTLQDPTYIGLSGSITNGYSYSFSKSEGLSAGLYTIKVTGSDSVGNFLEEEWIFIIADKSLRNQVRVLSGGTIFRPKATRRLNVFDEHGALLSLPRLKSEKNWEYKRRIQDAATHFANSAYRGLIHGITRELGLSLFNAISINPKIDSSGAFLANDPYIVFDGIWLLLYSDYSTGTLDWAVDRFQPGGNYEHITSLVSAVNNTSLFEASIENNIDLHTRSMTILNQSNRQRVKLEFVPQSKRFRLSNQHLAPGSVFFSDRTTFKTKKESVNLVNSKGEFYIDYTKGIITVYSTPKPKEYVRYQYTQYPFKALASPIVLHDINNSNFNVKMFQQTQQNDGSIIHGTPTSLGADIINELMTVSPLYWGV